MLASRFTTAAKAATALHRRPKSASSSVVRTLASVGDAVPSVELHKNFPPEKINLADFCRDKKIILLGLPGAFTPT